MASEQVCKHCEKPIRDCVHYQPKLREPCRGYIHEVDGSHYCDGTSGRTAEPSTPAAEPRKCKRCLKPYSEHYRDPEYVPLGQTFCIFEPSSPSPAQPMAGSLDKADYFMRFRTCLPRTSLGEYEFGREVPEPAITLNLLLKFAQRLQNDTDGVPSDAARTTLFFLGKVLEDTITGREYKPCGCGKNS